MKTVVNHLPLTKARVNLGQVVRRVHVNREFFILEKDGIPVVGLMHVDDLEDYLEMQNRPVKEQIQTSTAEYRRGAARSANQFLAELKAPRSKRKKK
jgi:restriction endonuclease